MSFNSLSVSDTLFFTLGFLSLFFAVLTVSTPHILRAAIYLMGVLCLSAGFYILLGAELLAGIQILVYVGGVVVLLVIAVMLTQNSDLSQDQATSRKKIVALLASGVFLTGGLLLLATSRFATTPPMPTLVTTTTQELDGSRHVLVDGADGLAIKNIGIALLDPGPRGFLLPFELISLLLLGVLVAGIVIARKEDLPPGGENHPNQEVSS